MAVPSLQPVEKLPRPTKIVAAVHNAGRLLCEFSPGVRELSVRELAGRLGLSKSTVHRLLVTLADLRLVEQDPDTGRYRLGLRMYELGTLVAVHIDLHEAATPCITELRNKTGEAVQVAMLEGREVLYVERLESIHTLRMFIREGYRIPANCSSTGKTLLAHLPDDERERLLDGWVLPARTPHSITDPEALRKELAAVRRRGWATNVNEAELGVASVAAPIRNWTGAVVAAVSLAGPITRMDRGSLRMFTPVVGETAEAISQRMGYRPKASRAQ
jgi:DNA-binding IclR family transcriptional regulator